jgi:hypothetical protein
MLIEVYLKQRIVYLRANKSCMGRGHLSHVEELCSWVS